MKSTVLKISDPMTFPQKKSRIMQCAETTVFYMYLRASKNLKGGPDKSSERPGLQKEVFRPHEITDSMNLTDTHFGDRLGTLGQAKGTASRLPGASSRLGSNLGGLKGTEGSPKSRAQLPRVVVSRRRNTNF